jgi:hypothetical protein
MKPAGAGAQTMLLFVDSLTSASDLHKQIKDTHQATFISCEEFRSANVNIGDHVERLSSMVTFSLTLKEHYHSNRYNVATVTDLAKSAAAKSGPVPHFSLADDMGVATHSRLVFSVNYNSVADSEPATHSRLMHLRRPVSSHNRTVYLPNGLSGCLAFLGSEWRSVTSFQKTAEAWNAPRTKKKPEAWHAPRTEKKPEAWNAPRTKKKPEAWNAPRTKKTPGAGRANPVNNSQEGR